MEAGRVTWQDALLEWFDREQRDLPWRRTRDPWAILVSELMLQQTQVARVIERWPQFLAEFPTPSACAARPAGDVVRAWQGLGYNRRALNLHRAATAVVERHDGQVPNALEPLLALPGIGPYTARAVLAFAFEQDVAVVDTNAARVLSRSQAGFTLSARAVQAEADRAVPTGTGWRWNQAMLDFGATVCQKRQPRCEHCPLRTHCQWAAHDFSAPDPALGTAGVSVPQSTFTGSDRQGRGRIVARVSEGPVAIEALGAITHWTEEPERVQRVLDGLVADGLVVLVDGWCQLP